MNKTSWMYDMISGYNTEFFFLKKQLLCQQKKKIYDKLFVTQVRTAKILMQACRYKMI